MNDKRNFAIAGAGIGGLTLAIALQRKGFRVRVFEQAEETKPLGAGLGLAANAVKAFADIGIDSEILQAGKVLRRLMLKDERGKVLAETNSEKVSKKYGAADNFTIHRANLHDVLLRQLHTGTLQLGKRCADFEQSANGVTIRFQDATTTEADYLIACDGINSIFRKRLLPESTLRYAGYTCWRAVIDKIPGELNLEETSETWGQGSRFGIVPLLNNRLYWFACLNASQNDPGMKKYGVADLLSHFRNFHDPIPAILRNTSDEQLIWGDIMDIKPLDRFAFDNILLMGDAAHATTPNMGQGACMAIEDAAVLANLLDGSTDVRRSFITFEAKRMKRTKKIVNGSWRLGRIAQLENPLLMWLRNALVRATPTKVAEKQMQFLYEVSLK